VPKKVLARAVDRNRLKRLGARGVSACTSKACRVKDVIVRVKARRAMAEYRRRMRSAWSGLRVVV
jgi:RNase P protein component